MTKPDRWVQDRLQRSPVRRERRALRTSRVELARQLRLNDSVLYLAELGCYNNIPLRLLNFFECKEVNTRKLCDEYSSFVKNERKIAGELFNLLDFDPKSGPLDPVEALSLYIGSGSRADLAKALCLSPALLWKLTRHLPASLPLDFRIALRQAGLNPIQIEQLEENYAY